MEIGRDEAHPRIGMARETGDQFHRRETIRFGIAARQKPNPILGKPCHQPISFIHKCPSTWAAMCPVQT